MVNRYIIYFSILSIIGYFYECIAMVIWTGKWDNRGFLFGPAIPIYGAGALAGTLLFRYLITDYTYLKVFLIGMAGSAVLEYVVHYSMEKMFHAYWWDYSKSPLNINGRICLPASIGFGIAAVIIIYYINPFILPLIEGLNDLTAQFVSVLCTAIFTADLTLTLSVLSSFIDRVENMDRFINEHMDVFVDSITSEDKGINTRFYNAFEKLDERKKRLIDDRIDRTISSMNELYRQVVTKVKGFRGRNARHLNYMQERLKERFSRSRHE